MIYYSIKILVSALLIVAVSETAKKSSLFGAIIASIPQTSVLAMIWLYGETKDAQKIIGLSRCIFWMVIPSLVLFILLPLLLKLRLNFFAALALSMTGTSLAYGLMIYILNYFGIKP